MPDSLLGEILEGEPLTDREIEVLYGMAIGDTADKIGKYLFLSPDTVKDYRKRAIAKLGARNNVHAVAVAIGKGIVNIQIIMDEYERKDV